MKLLTFRPSKIGCVSTRNGCLVCCVQFRTDALGKGKKTSLLWPSSFNKISGYSVLENENYEFKKVEKAKWTPSTIFSKTSWIWQKIKRAMITCLLKGKGIWKIGWIFLEMKWWPNSLTLWNYPRYSYWLCGPN